MEAEFACLLPAAGGSERLGRAKQLVRFRQQSLVRRSARLLLDLRPALCLVVTGADQRAVSIELDDLPLRQVYNPDWESGMASSIAAGVDALPEQVGGVLILLCDQWRVTLDDLASLLEHWRQTPERIAAADWAGGPGAPAIFPRRLFTSLAALSGDSGAKVLINKELDSVIRVPMQAAADDLDTAEELAIMRTFEPQ